MSASYDYGLCPVCGRPMVSGEDGDIDLHTWPEDGVSDIHAECCSDCNDTVTVPRQAVHRVLDAVAQVIEDLCDSELRALDKLTEASGWRQP